MSFWSRVKKGYTSIDKKVGGYLPGGSKPGSTSTPTAPSGSSSSSTSSSTSSSFTGGGSYNPVTKTYTSPSGEKQSRSYSNVPTGTAIELKAPTKTSGGSSTTTTTQPGQLGTPITPGVSKQDTTGYLGTPPPTQEAGVFTVTPKEASAIQGAGVPYWTQQSTTPADAITESAFIASTPQTYRNIMTRNLYLSNTRNILAGQEAYKQYSGTVSEFKKDPASFEGRIGVEAMTTQEGTSYQLTPAYFESTIDTKGIYEGALGGAKERFESLPGGTKARIKASSYGVGVSSAVIGIGEFGATVIANMGMATSDESGKFSSRSVKFGGTLGEIRNYPATPTTSGFLDAPGRWIKEKGSAPEFLGQATVIAPMVYSGVSGTISNIKTYGWVGGSVETLAGASPLRIKTGVYSQPITSQTKFTDTKVLKFTKGDTTYRVYSGKSGSINLRGYEASTLKNGKIVGRGYTVTDTPFISIRGGGAYSYTGTRSTITPYAFGGAGSGRAYLVQNIGRAGFFQPQDIKGGISDVAVSKGVTVYTSPGKYSAYSNINQVARLTGGGAYRDTGTGVKTFVSGRVTPGYRGERLGGETFVWKPSGKYKLSPTMAGKEYDLNAIFNRFGSGTGSGQGFSSGGGGTGTKLKTIKVTDGSQIKAVIPQTTTASQPTQSTFIAPATITTPGKITKFKYPAVTETVKIKAPEITTEAGTVNIVVPTTTTKPTSRSRGRSATVTIPKIDTVTIQKPVQETVTAPAVVQVKKVRIDQIGRRATTTLNFPGVWSPSTFSPYDYTPTPKPPVIPIPAFAGGGRFLKMGNVKAVRSPSAYIPSYSALLFKIRGKAPKGVATGIRFRPITSGYSFSRKKVKRVRRVRR